MTKSHHSRSNDGMFPISVDVVNDKSRMMSQYNSSRNTVNNFQFHMKTNLTSCQFLTKRTHNDMYTMKHINIKCKENLKK